jgi:hypothetical protein
MRRKIEVTLNCLTIYRETVLYLVIFKVVVLEALNNPESDGPRKSHRSACRTKLRINFAGALMLDVTLLYVCTHPTLKNLPATGVTRNSPAHVGQGRINLCFRGNAMIIG